MQCLFQNLIANALKFCQQGEPPVVTLTRRLLENGYWEIQIEDNGIGFDEKHLDRIFKPFERLHSSQEFEGSGLGMAICQKIISMHGGTITANSIRGKGSTFILTLPSERSQKDRFSNADK